MVLHRNRCDPDEKHIWSMQLFFQNCILNFIKQLFFQKQPHNKVCTL